MLSNALVPVTISRYAITFGDIFSRNQMGYLTFGIRVRIGPPSGWKAKLLRSAPLMEYVEASVDYGGGRMIPLQWEQGDIRVSQLRLDGVRATPLHLFEVKGDAIYYPMAFAGSPLFTGDGVYPLVLTITRTYDQEAISLQLKLVFVAGRVSLSKEESPNG